MYLSKYLCLFVCNAQGDEWLSGFADEPLCTVLSNNHNFHLTGKWYDEKCSESGYGFVCQKPQGKIPSVSFCSIVLMSVCPSLPLCIFFMTSVLFFWNEATPALFLSANQKTRNTFNAALKKAVLTGLILDNIKQ